MIRTETGLTVALSAEKDRVTLLQHTLDSTLAENIAITHELKNGTFTLSTALIFSLSKLFPQTSAVQKPDKL